MCWAPHYITGIEGKAEYNVEGQGLKAAGKMRFVRTKGVSLRVIYMDKMSKALHEKDLSLIGSLHGSTFISWTEFGFYT